MAEALVASGIPVVTVEVAIDPGLPDSSVDADRWRRLAESALVTEGVDHGELTLVFVDESAMAELNAAHMDAEGPTDVLAFPIDGRPDSTVATGTPVLLGDVVICPAVARRYATDHEVTFDDEVALLVVHGILHVLGHDHAEPAETEFMKAREQALLVAHHRS